MCVSLCQAGWDAQEATVGTAVFQNTRGQNLCNIVTALMRHPFFVFYSWSQPCLRVHTMYTQSEIQTGPLHCSEVSLPFCHLTRVTVVTPPSCFRPLPRPSLVCREYSLEGARSSMSPKWSEAPVVSDGYVTLVTRQCNPLGTVRPAFGVAGSSALLCGGLQDGRWGRQAQLQEGQVFKADIL